MGLLDWLFNKKEQNEKSITHSESELVDGEKIVWTEYNDGTWAMESGPGEPWETYFQLSERIQNEKDIFAKLDACEKSYQILPDIAKLFRQDGGLPPSILCRDMGPILYMRLGKWFAAHSAIQKCIEAKAYRYKKDEKAVLKYLAEYQLSVEIAVSFLLENPGFLQSKIYKALSDTKANLDCLKDFTRSSLLIRKEPAGKSNKLFLEETVLENSDINIYR